MACVHWKHRNGAKHTENETVQRSGTFQGEEITIPPEERVNYWSLWMQIRHPVFIHPSAGENKKHFNYDSNHLKTEPQNPIWAAPAPFAVSIIISRNLSPWWHGKQQSVTNNTDVQQFCTSTPFRYSRIWSSCTWSRCGWTFYSASCI